MEQGNENMPVEPHVTNDHQTVARLNAEIRYLRERLRQIGFDGDSAYERALQRGYEVEIERRLLRLGRPERFAVEDVA